VSLVKKPLEIKMLEDYISDWKEVEGGILLFPKDHFHFNKLFVRSRFIFMDRVFDFLGMTEMVPKERMNKDSRRLHRSLVELGCELSWSGTILRKPYFKNYSTLNTLQKHIPSLRISDKLVNELNESNSVMELVRRTSPDELYVTLSSFMQPLYPVEPNFDLIKALLRCYHNPIEVAWVTSLNKSISRTLGYKEGFINIFKLIDSISEVLLKISQEYSK